MKTRKKTILRIIITILLFCMIIAMLMVTQSCENNTKILYDTDMPTEDYSPINDNLIIDIPEDITPNLTETNIYLEEDTIDYTLWTYFVSKSYFTDDGLIDIWEDVGLLTYEEYMVWLNERIRESVAEEAVERNLERIKNNVWYCSNGTTSSIVFNIENVVYDVKGFR